MAIDLTYTNKAGVSLQSIIDALGNGTASLTKKDIQTAINTTTNIDPLLKKLEEASLIKKEKDGTKVLYVVVATTPIETKAQVKKTKSKKVVDDAPVVVESIPEPVVESILEPIAAVVEEVAVTQKKKVTKAKPKTNLSPAEVKDINRQTENISKDHQITNLIKMEEVKKPVSEKKTAAPKTEEVSKENLELLRNEMASRLGKEVTAVLHKRHDRALKERKKSAAELYAAQQALEEKEKEENEAFDTENPYRFVTNFFTSTLNGEKATPYFRRRDEYVVKSIYNKFRALCEKVEDYAIAPQNLPFYRVITINEEEKLVKIYHIDMNRIVRGVHTIFKLNRYDDQFLKFKQ